MNNQKLSPQTVLITGAGGFIGSHITKIFAKNNWQVFALVRNNIPEELHTFNNVQILKADISDECSVENIFQMYDIVIHCMGLASDIGSDFVFRRVNFEAVKIFSKMAKSKFIFISTTDVYGLKDFFGEDEDTLPLEQNPINPYPKYKIKSENWIRKNLPKEKYVIIRPAAVYGDGDKTLEERFVKFLKNSRFIIHFGKWKGQNRWPLANVKNVAAAVYFSAIFDDFDGQSVNIIDQKHTTIEDFYRQTVEKYFPNKKFYTINLPFFVGYILGRCSTFLSNLMQLKEPIFDPSFYAFYHLSCNLDFSRKKLNKILELGKKMRVD